MSFTARSLGAIRHIANDKNFEPQRNNNFEVQITGLDNLYSARNSSRRLEGASKNITLSVATYSAPQININPIPVSYGNDKVKFAGTPEFQESNINLNDFIGIDVEDIILAWQKLVYDPKNSRIGLAEEYKKEAYLIEYAPDGSSPRQWKLIGCWPSSVQLGEFSQEGGNVRQISMTLTYDYAIPIDAK